MITGTVPKPYSTIALTGVPATLTISVASCINVSIVMMTLYILIYLAYTKTGILSTNVRSNPDSLSVRTMITHNAGRVETLSPPTFD
jgi:hypothetical protein